MAASVALTASEITIGKDDFLNIWFFKFSITVLGEFSQLLQQAKMGNYSMISWIASQLVTYFVGVSYIVSLLFRMCNDNLEITACAKNIINNDQHKIPVLIGVVASFFAICMADVIYSVSISAFRSSKLFQSK